MLFKFLCHVSSSQRSEVCEHYLGASSKVKAQFEAALDYLGKLSREKWSNPRVHAAKLDKQEWRDFYEIRFKAENVQQRPIGFFGPGPNEFTFVIWCTEKGGSLQPSTWFKTANRHRLDIAEGSASVKPLFKDDDDDE